MANLENKLKELNNLVIENNNPLFEFRFRINKYVNAFLQNKITLNDFDKLLEDFDAIKSKLTTEDLQVANNIDLLKKSIKEELSMM